MIDAHYNFRDIDGTHSSSLVCRLALESHRLRKKKTNYFVEMESPQPLLRRRVRHVCEAFCEKQDIFRDKAFNHKNKKEKCLPIVNGKMYVYNFIAFCLADEKK